jgi:S-adenosylmethionine hydrolase
MKKILLPSAFFLITVLTLRAAPNALVLQTDFSLKDGAVSAMKGVAFGVDRTLPIFDLTHEIPPYNIWEASFRLVQTVPYWPKGTVFVSVVDPGVGTERKSVVAQTKDGHYIVGPDNGQLTFLADRIGLTALRQIDEKVNRLQGSEKSYTFHGRDVYVYTAARLAAGLITYEQVGPELPLKPVMIPYQKATLENGVLRGNVPILDVQYGNIWTNVGADLFEQLKAKPGDFFRVTLRDGKQTVYQGTMPYATTFGAVPEGKPLLYLNSLLEVSFALNQDSFAQKNGVKSGPDWSVEVTRK